MKKSHVAIDSYWAWCLVALANCGSSYDKMSIKPGSFTMSNYRMIHLSCNCPDSLLWQASGKHANMFSYPSWSWILFLLCDGWWKVDLIADTHARGTAGPCWVPLHSDNRWKFSTRRGTLLQCFCLFFYHFCVRLPFFLFTSKKDPCMQFKTKYS